jgi:hypothetical protein
MEVVDTDTSGTRKLLSYLTIYHVSGRDAIFSVLLDGDIVKIPIPETVKQIKYITQITLT